MIVGFAATIAAILGVIYKFGRWTKAVEGQMNDLRFTVRSLSLVLKTIVDIFIELRKRLLGREVITLDMVIDILSEASERVSESVIETYFSIYGEKSGNPNVHKERRKRELLEKARQRQISYAEAEELKNILEDQKKRHEASGDIVGAILLGLLLLFVLAILAGFLKEGKG